MAFTYDVATDRGKVRMLITDRDYENQIFQDDEIDAFLSLESASVRRAAATALETIASDQALVLKVVKTLDLETDGAAVAEALMKRAAALRKQEDASGAVDIAEMTTDYDGFHGREAWEKYVLRGGL